MCDKKAGQRRAQQLVSNNFYYTPPGPPTSPPPRAPTPHYPIKIFDTYIFIKSFLYIYPKTMSMAKRRETVAQIFNALSTSTDSTD